MSADWKTVGAPAALHDVRAVVFDMDGLLLNTESLANAALHLAAESLGLDMPQSFCFQLIGVPADGCRRLLFERFGPDAPADRFFALAGEQLMAQIDRGLLGLRPGAAALLAHLDACGVPRAVATSSARHKTEHHLRAAGIIDRFDAIVTRDDVMRGKPHPDLFLRAAELLGVPPASCLALEDSHNGVRAAHAAGMPVIMVPDLLPATDEMRTACHAVLDSLAEVIGLLRCAPTAGAKVAQAFPIVQPDTDKETR